MTELDKRQKELHEQFTSMIQEMDMLYVRKIKGDMHKCAAGCCDNLSNSAERNTCIEICATAYNAAGEFIQSEINHCQNQRIQCMIGCTNLMKNNTGEKPALTLSEENQNCLLKCVDAQFENMRTVSSNLKQMLVKLQCSNAQT